MLLRIFTLLVSSVHEWIPPSFKFFIVQSFIIASAFFIITPTFYNLYRYFTSILIFVSFYHNPIHNKLGIWSFNDYSWKNTFEHSHNKTIILFKICYFRDNKQSSINNFPPNTRTVQHKFLCTVNYYTSSFLGLTVASKLSDLLAKSNWLYLFCSCWLPSRLSYFYSLF